MTDLLDMAVWTARALSPEVQDDIALDMLTLAGDNASLYQLTREPGGGLAKSHAEVAQGDFVIDDDVRDM